MKYDDIQNAIKDAMINKDTLKRDCLRMIVSDIKNLTINANPPKEITDEICVKVLQKSVKTHEDSISQFRLNGREESANKEQAELDIIRGFLPKMLSAEETRDIVVDVMSEFKISPQKRNMGVIMKSLPNVEGLDRKLVSKILQGMLT
jgi:uncharacterized protein YqeY